MSSTVRRVLGNADGPVKSVIPYLSCPNGQVKNFLNACRSVGEVEDQMRIAVVGSKSQEGGGLWHQYFVNYLLLFQKKVILDFFDFAETPHSRTYTTGNGFVTVEWVAEGFTQADVNDYHLIIDDAWTYESGPGLRLDYKGKYSWKGTPAGKPFLHETEVREFSEKPIGQIQSGCRCPVCRVIKESTKTYEEYVLIRSYCARLGYVVPCVGMSDLMELKKVADMLRDISQYPSVELTKKSYLHILTSLTEEIPIGVTVTHAYKVDKEPRFQNYTRFKKYKLHEEKEVFKYFQGKNVVFSGVSPTILNSTTLGVGGEVDIMFVGNLETWRAQVLVPLVYCAVPASEVAQSFPQYQFSGRMFMGYREYVLRSENYQALVKPEIAQEDKFSKYLPVAVFHSAQVEKPLKDPAPPKIDYVLKTPVLEKGKMVLGEFSSSRWRVSLYQNRDGTWGSVKKIIERINTKYRGFLPAGNFLLPWDMTRDEVRQVEMRNGILEDDYRSDLVREITGFRDAPNSEWVSQGRQVVRSAMPHPVTWSYIEPNLEEEMQYYVKTFGFEEGFDKAQEYLARLRQVHDTGG